MVKLLRRPYLPSSIHISSKIGRENLFDSLLHIISTPYTSSPYSIDKHLQYTQRFDPDVRVSAGPRCLVVWGAPLACASSRAHVIVDTAVCCLI